MIENYSFGTIQINGKVFQHDVIIFRGKVNSWWRVRGHEVVERDVVDILRQKPQAVIFGTGSNEIMIISDGVKDLIINRNIDLIIENTQDATKKFNELSEKQVDVAAFLHLTC